MLALSLWQPWASLLLADAKPNYTGSGLLEEYRSWSLPARVIGPRVAIHAAKRMETSEMIAAILEDTMGRGEGTVKNAPEALKILEAARRDALPRGALIGSVVFTGCRQVSEQRYAWIAEAPKLLAAPIPCRGMRQFFQVEMADA